MPRTPQIIQNLLLFSRTSQGSFDFPPGFPGNSGAICPEPPKTKNIFLFSRTSQGSFAIPPGVFQGIQVLYAPKKIKMYFCLLEPPKVHLIYPQVFQGIQVLYAQNPPPKKNTFLLAMPCKNLPRFICYTPSFSREFRWNSICPEPPK